jgi:HK97 family phage prohead protease
MIKKTPDKFINFAFQEVAKAEGDDPDYVSFEGIASTDEVDREGDIVLASAFKKSIQENGKVPMLYWHDWGQVLGYFDSFEIAEKSLKVRGNLYIKDEAGEKNHSLMRKGIISEMSIGGRVIQKANKDGVRIITELALSEISIVPQGKATNPGAVITMVKAEAKSILDQHGEDSEFLAYIKAYKPLGDTLKEPETKALEGPGYFETIQKLLGGN